MTEQENDFMKKGILKLLTGLLILIPSFIFSADSQVRVNSVGFLPANDKGASVSTAVTAFTLKNASTNAVVFSSTAANITGPVNATDSNETVYKLNFTSFTTPGTYYVDVTGVGRSVNFTIADNVYNDAYITSYKSMYYWRCGMAVSAVTNGQTFGHGACHTNDANQNYIGFGSNIRDGKGGWHDAGDFNKYIVNAGITMGMFFMAWEHYGSVLNNIPLTYMPNTVAGYPEYNVSAYPDFLKELRWEMDWVLKMQYPDGSGKVSHKLSTLNFGGFIMPETETATRYYVDWGSAATADFVAMCAMAARIFYPYDPVYAQKCLDAAWVSYNFLRTNTANKNPDQSAFTTGGYGTTDSDDRLWAAAEMWATTGDANAKTDLDNRANAYSDKTDEDFDWGNVKNLGMYTYLMCTRTGKNTTIVNDIQADLIADANTIVTKKNNHAYSRPLGTNFYWGCNGSVARQTMLLQIANMVSPNANYVNTALDSLGYLLGRNPFRRSYVTGIGTSPPMYPHDRTSGADGITNPVPGYLVGGSNGTNSGDPALTAMPAGLGAAMYWTDNQDSYASNEIAINWQGALVYALAGFCKNPSVPTFTPTNTNTPDGPTYTFTNTATQTNTYTPSHTFTVTPTVVLPVAICSGPSLIIDGSLDEAFWQAGEWTEVLKVVTGTMPAPVSARYKVRYDDYGFTLGVQITDSALYNDSGTEWYNDDSVELYLDVNNDKSTTYGADDYQFSVRYVEGVIREQSGDPGNAYAAYDYIVGGYTVEIDVPWADLGVTPFEGMVMGFDVGVNYDQDGDEREGVLMWNGTSDNWQNPSNFGEVTLGAPCGAAETPTHTYTNTSTYTHTASYTSTFTNTATVPTNTFTSTATVPTNTFTNTATVPTNTFTSTATAPTYTFTSTATAPANTFTSTATVPTNTFTSTATVPTNTFTSTATAPTYTFTNTATVPTNTFTNTATVPTNTFTNTATVPTNTFTSTVTVPTNTFTSTATAPTNTFTQTPTIPTPTYTVTPVIQEGDKQKITDVMVFPHPYNASKNPYAGIKFNLAKSAAVVKIRLYSSAFRLLEESDIAKNCHPGSNIGAISGRRLSTMSNGTYYFVLISEDNAIEVRSKVDKLIIMK